MKSPGNDTIAAIATGVGGGIGIVRVSGPDALPIADRIFRSRAGRPLSDAAPFFLVLGALADPVTSEPIDEVLAVRMPEGRSYTGESIVEIQAHGGSLVLDLVLQAALRAGARMAGPGEFTRRAFLNGRLDLTKAEAIADIVGAENEESLRGALSQLRGALGDTIARLRDDLLELVARSETALDFEEEESSGDPPSAAQIASLALDMRRLASRSNESPGARTGVQVVFAGPANAGKSSIFNYLLGFKRSIVTPIPGTTRDYIEERTLIGNSSVTLIDTAGLRPTDDLVEMEGARRCLQRIEEAQIVVLVFDGSVPAHQDEETLFKLTAERSPIVVIAKADLPIHRSPDFFRAEAPDLAVFSVSTITGEGFPPFTAALASRCRAARQAAGPPEPLPNIRHRNALERAAGSLEDAVQRVSAGLFDQAVFDLRAALATLDEISGATATEDILERIFSRFCIGK